MSPAEDMQVNTTTTRTLSPDDLRRLAERTGIDETLSTREAAALLGRKPQTLRRWSSNGDGPIHPRNVGGVLRWPLAEIAALMRGQTEAA
jgi:Helix-turn-helix domain